MFSEVESVSMLVHLLRDYSVHLTPDEHGNVDVKREWFRTFATLFKQSLVFLVVSVVPINDK